MSSFSTRLDPSSPDEDLIIRCRRGDLEALDLLMLRYYRKRFAFFREVGMDYCRALGEGEANHCYFRCFGQCLHSYRAGETRFSSYFLTALIHEIHNELKNHHYIQGQRILSLDEELPGSEETLTLADCVQSLGEEDPRIRYRYIESLERMGRLKGQIDQGDLEIINKKINGFSYEELAEYYHSTPKKMRVCYERYLRLAKKAIKIHEVIGNEEKMAK